MSASDAKLWRVIALGQFSLDFAPTKSRLRSLNTVVQCVDDLAQLTPPLGSHDILLTDGAWLYSRPLVEHAVLSQHSRRAAAWLSLADIRSDFATLLAWRQLGVQRFFYEPLDSERLVNLVESVQESVQGSALRAVLYADPQVHQATLHALQQAGIAAQAFSHATAVWEALPNDEPDVLIVDESGPDQQSAALIALLRQRPNCEHLPVLFLLGSVGGALPHASDAVACTAAALPKPFAPTDLVTAAKSRALRYRALRRAEAMPLQHEARARLRLEQLRMAVDEHAIVSMTDAAGNITYANDRFCAISGYQREELLGHNHRMIKSAQHPSEFFQDLWRTISAGQVWRGEVCNRRKDGSLYWVEATIVPFLDSRGRPTQYISIRTDVTILKCNELALVESERKLREAQALAHIGHWEVNLTTGRLTCSEEVYRILDGSFESPSFDDFRTLLPLGDLKSDESEHVTRYDIVQRILRPDSTVRYVHLLAHTSPQGLSGTLQDITERKAAEMQLIAAREEAERASRAKSDFLSSMSHELRTPLNAIIGFAQILEYDSELNADQIDSVREILKAGQHLLDLINEVLDLAKIEAGRLTLSLEAVELSPIIEGCLGLVTSLADKSNIRLSYDALPRAVVWADRTRLKQVLLNLLSNAIKYNRADGSVKITVSTPNAEHLRICVADTGRGIPAARLVELFQPFNRLSAEKSAIEGTGIGLSITRSIVELMGGQVGVESDFGLGSRFWIDLPQALPAGANGAGSDDDPATWSTAPQAIQQTVLYIEDNPANLKLVAQIIGLRRYIHLLTAHTPELGLELARTHRPDLILLDINLPGMNGYQVLDVIQNDSRLQTIPVVAVTANAMTHDIERGRSLGFTDYLTKPIDVSQFLNIIDRCLAGNPKG